MLGIHRFEKGGPPFDAGKLDFRLAISVHDDDHEILLGEVTDQFQSGVARQIELPVKDPNTTPYRISLTPRWQKDITQKDQWTIKIPLFIIDKPIGCGFPLTVPMESFAADRTRDSRSKKKWQVRHIGPPPAN